MRKLFSPKKEREGAIKKESRGKVSHKGQKQPITVKSVILVGAEQSQPKNLRMQGCSDRDCYCTRITT